MKKVREVPKVVVNFLQRASALVGRNREEIHWSQSKRKFVKANNRTLASEDQVLKYLQDHPDETTRQRAIIHLGPGVVPPVITDATGSARAEIARLTASIDDWKSGTQRNAESLHEQGLEALRQLALISQLLGSIQQGLDADDAVSQKISKGIDDLRDNILKIATQLKEQESKFGQTDQKLAESIAFNQQFADLLREVQQQLEDLEEKMDRLRAQEAANSTYVQAGYIPGWGITLFLAVTALIVGILVTALAVRDNGLWLNIPGIYWGLLASAIVFLGLYTWVWHQAERNAQLFSQSGRS